MKCVILLSYILLGKISYQFLIQAENMSNKKHKLLEDLLIFDSHCDTANVFLDDSSYIVKKDKAHITKEKIKKGGLKAQIFAIWVNPIYSPYRSIKKALLLYNALDKQLFSKDYATKVTTTKDMHKAIKNDKLACWLSIEGGHIIENSTQILEFFNSLGLRIMTLTHTKNTDWADSSGDKPKWDGLNKLGRRIVKKMDELNMIIDVSHSSDKTVEDVFDVTSKPIMASHSCARALCDIPRNISDDLIKEISDRKGYIGVNFYPGFLKKNIYDQVIKNLEKYEKWFNDKIMGKEDDPDYVNQMELELYMKMIKGNDKANINDLVDHIVHISDVGGIDCVGLGSDFDGIPTTPTDLTDASCYPKLVDGLSSRGFNEEDIRKIMGLNLNNFLKQFD